MAENQDPSQLDTAPVSQEAIAEIKRQAALAPRLSLIVYHPGGSQIVPLAPLSSLVVGRGPPAEVVIDDRSLSRTHARISVEGSEVIVDDLGSTNGTRVNGEPVRSRRVRPGDEIAFGAVLAAVHRKSSAEAGRLGLDSHERFLTLLEEEVVRARFFGRGFALLMVRAGREDEALHSRWYQRLRGLLRPVDRAAIYGPGQVEIALPEVGPDEARGLAERITSDRREGEPPLRCGWVTFPAAGGSADELLEACREACYRAAAEGAAAPSAPAAEVVVVSAAMQKLFQTIDKLTRSPIPVLVLGETGTGKELVARAIHQRGPRQHRPFVAVNCGAIPGSLIESTLFGHERGAFTGATQDQPGVFESADGGAVFLDEVAELTPAAQASLLRVLENKQVVRVGSTRERTVDVRILAATHRDLEQMCEAGAFRWDLFYRLNAMTLLVPPLRERSEEIPALVDRFVARANQVHGTQVRGLDPEALELLLRYRWPGNVRELKNAIDRAVVLASGDTATKDDLPERIRGRPDDGVAPAPQATGDYKSRLQQLEAQLIIEALNRAGGVQTEAARSLGMPLRTLVHKIKTLGIRRQGYGAP